MANSQLRTELILFKSMFEIQGTNENILQKQTNKQHFPEKTIFWLIFQKDKKVITL